MDRIANDQYFTDERLVMVLGEYLDSFDRQSIVDPCCGEGSISTVLRGLGGRLLSFDRDPGLEYPDLVFDARDSFDKLPARYRVIWGNPDWVITNPPYRQPDCQEIIENSYSHAVVGVAMLLRLSYLEPCKNRVEFLRKAWLSHLLVFNPRPQFRADTRGTDSSTVAWFVWQKRKGYGTKIINVTDWKS